MKISELIAELQDVLDNEGDMDAVVFDYSTDTEHDVTLVSGEGYIQIESE